MHKYTIYLLTTHWLDEEQKEHHKYLQTTRIK